jgi:magnesium transporter
VKLAKASLRRGRHAKKAGLPPGTLIYTGERRLERVSIDVIDYNEAEMSETEVKSIDECSRFRESPTVSWINVCGLHDVEIIEKLGELFGVHPLVLEDIVHTDQRPKFEDFGDYVFLVLKTLHLSEDGAEIQTEQISLILGSNYLVSFQEVPEDPFENVRGRLRQSKGRIRTMGPDYLAYALIDAIVDHYFFILEATGDRIEHMSARAVNDPNPETLRDVQDIKHMLNHLRRTIWPLREVISAFHRDESGLIGEATGVYLRDVYDHTIQAVEMVETFRDMSAGLFDTYLSSVSNRMNEVMKVLTIIATIFIPVTFVAGVYGMNFQRMPELSQPWGYPAALAVMLVVALGMVFYFRRKRWL